jgi:hypothetical protein
VRFLVWWSIGKENGAAAKTIWELPAAMMVLPTSVETKTSSTTDPFHMFYRADQSEMWNMARRSAPTRRTRRRKRTETGSRRERKEKAIATQDYSKDAEETFVLNLSLCTKGHFAVLKAVKDGTEEVSIEVANINKVVLHTLKGTQYICNNALQSTGCVHSSQQVEFKHDCVIAYMAKLNKKGSPKSAVIAIQNRSIFPS